MTGDTDTTAGAGPEKLERVRSAAAIVPDLVDGFRDTRTLVHTLHLAAAGLPDAAKGSAIQALTAAIEGRLDQLERLLEELGKCVPAKKEPASQPISIAALAETAR
jgi:ABC-type transporter Mla subunit MlaD